MAGVAVGYTGILLFYSVQAALNLEEFLILDQELYTLYLYCVRLIFRPAQ